jgi:NAD-dependent dihydropyrimidine dehydrogenase PreA subunit
MRDDATFIGIEIDDAVAGDLELAKRLEEACPVDIFAATEHGVEIVHANVDECILCALCIDAAPQGSVQIHKLYSNEVLGATPAEA